MEWMKLDTLWRLFLVQGSRNVRTLDGLGFLHVMTPLIRRLAREGRDRTAAARRYAGYFNAAPNMVPYIAGAVTGIELDAARGVEREGPDGMAQALAAGERASRVRGAMSSALTARGTSFMETALIPLSLTIGCIFAMYSWYSGPIVFLIIFNLYNFRTRISGYRTGLHAGEGTGRALAEGLFAEQRYLGSGAAFVSGVFTALIALRAWDYGGPRLAVWGAAVMAGSVVLGGRYPHFRVAVMLTALTLIFLAVW